MRAVQVTSLGGPDAVELNELPEPVATRGKVLIEVHAAGVSFPDLLFTRGEYQLQPELPFVLGTELTGVVLEAPGTSFSRGDRVAAFTGQGGYTEQALVAEQAVFPLPDEVTFEQGAAFLLNYLTVHFALRRRGRLQPEETVLVQGAAGGIGTAALQLGKALGARTIAVVSNEEKGVIAREAGADEVVAAEGFKEAVAALTGGRGVDLVVDPVGGDRFTDSLRSLSAEGRLLVVGFTGGEIPTVKVNRLLLKNIDIVGVSWGSFAMSQPGYISDQWRELMALAKSARIRPPIGATFGLEGAAEALRQLDERRATGKIVLLPQLS